MIRCVALAAATLALAGCGGDDGDELVVSAATSLKPALEEHGGARLAFGGSDELAAQIRQGVKPDVYAAASTELPDRLFDEGLVERPTAFATSRLVVAVPAGERRIRKLADLARPGVELVVGAGTVPVGSYTRAMLARLPAPRREAILANVRSEEPDVGGVVAKLVQGAANAGFVYATDVEAAGGRLEAIELPRRLPPRIAYSAAVVTGTGRSSEARAYVAGLLRGEGLAALRAAGFGPPPR